MRSKRGNPHSVCKARSRLITTASICSGRKPMTLLSKGLLVPSRTKWGSDLYLYPSVSISERDAVGVHSVKMTLRVRCVAAAFSLASLLMPGLSCFVPDQALSAGANECCRQMGPQCGSREMSSPQSCCQAPSQQSAKPYVVVNRIENSRLTSAAGIALGSWVASSPALVAEAPVLIVVPFHSPPQALPQTSSVLRI
jgi:hypothetical protein